MTKIPCKGTKLQMTIATVLTDLAQVISIDLPEAESETYESDTLDNEDAGIPYDPTGRTEGGSMSAELFFDPALAGHQAITDLLSSPAKCNWAVVFADEAHTTWPIPGAGVSFGGSVALGDGLKGSLSVKLDGIPTYP